MNTTTPLGRLAEARPEAAARTAELVTADERDAVLQAIFLAEAVPAAPTAPARRRRRMRVATALAAPALAGLVVVALVWAGAPSADGPSRPAVPGESAGENVVLDRVRLAVAAADDLVLHMKSDHGNGVLWEAWHDTVDRHSRSTSLTLAGAPMYDHELRTGAEGTTVKVVSHGDRAWWTYVAPQERDGYRSTLGLLAEDIRAQLADGTLEEIGPETLDGRDVLHLRWVPESKPGFLTVPGDMWVDVTTYLPVRSVNRWGVNGEKATRSDYEWLPRSAATLARLTAPVPAGFVQRSAAPTDPPGTQGVG